MKPRIYRAHAGRWVVKYSSVGPLSFPAAYSANPTWQDCLLFVEYLLTAPHARKSA